MPNSKNNTILPEKITDLMRKTLEELPHAITMSPHVLSEIITTMKHARMFIVSKNIMHATGVNLYDKLIANLEDLGKEEI